MGRRVFCAYGDIAFNAKVLKDEARCASSKESANFSPAEATSSEDTRSTQSRTQEPSRRRKFENLARTGHVHFLGETTFRPVYITLEHLSWLLEDKLP